MSTKRLKYTAEFKLQAVRMILDQKLSVAEVARKLGVVESRLLRLTKATAQCHSALTTRMGGDHARDSRRDEAAVWQPSHDGRVEGTGIFVLGEHGGEVDENQLNPGSPASVIREDHGFES